MAILAIEAIDSSGKHTQSKAITEQLVLRGLPAKLVSFPDYKSESGKIILNILKEEISFPSDKIRAEVLQSLMSTNRYEQIDMLTEYKYSSDKVLICDRYFASGLAYGEADGLDPQRLAQMHRGLPSADIWIMIDITPEESVRRRPERRDEYEKRPGLQELVRSIYLDMFRNPRFDGLWYVVNGMQSQQEVQEAIMSIIEPVLEHQ